MVFGGLKQKRGSRCTAAASPRRAVGYPEPFEEVAAIKDYVAFYWDRVDAWFEEDDEIFVHARDPYKRVDVVNSSRRVKVTVGGVTVAETRRARFLFETRLPTRYYIPPEDVRMDLLVPSEKVTSCPYKGHSALLFGQDRRPPIFRYRMELSRSDPRKPQDQGLSLFLRRHVDEILLDDVPVPRPLTPWSTDWQEKAATLPDPRGPATRL